MAAHAHAATPFAFPIAPNTELENKTLLDSVVIKVSPRIGSHPERYGVHEPTILAPFSPYISSRSLFCRKSLSERYIALGSY